MCLEEPLCGTWDHRSRRALTVHPFPDHLPTDRGEGRLPRPPRSTQEGTGQKGYVAEKKEEMKVYRNRNRHRSESTKSFRKDPFHVKT